MPGRSKPRNRMVVFRLTEEEYDSLKSACASSGERSLSDYTRAELLSGFHGNLPDAAAERQYFEISQKLSDLQCLIKNVLDLVVSEPSRRKNRNGLDGNHDE